MLRKFLQEPHRILGVATSQGGVVFRPFSVKLTSMRFAMPIGIRRADKRLETSSPEARNRKRLFAVMPRRGSFAVDGVEGLAAAEAALARRSSIADEGCYVYHLDLSACILE